MLRRVLVVLAVVIGVVALTPAVASAHSAGGVVPTDYKSTLDSFGPSVPGIQLSVKELGNKMQLTNSTDTDLVVLGYSGEPYIRVSKHGVYVNEKSPAYFTNQSLNGANYVPPSADAKATPEWHKTSSGDLADWHDHRIHWVASIDPPDVIAQPHVSHVVIPVWTVNMQYGAQTLTATGHLTWVPPSSAVPWYLIAILALAVGVALAFVPGAPKTIAVALLALVAGDIFHTIGISLDIAGTTSSRVVRALGSVLPSAVAWLVGLYGARRILKTSEDAPWFGLFAACLIGVLGGFSDLSAVTHSQVPFVWAPWIDRAAVSFSLGLGAGLVVTFLLVLRRQRSTTTVEPEQAGIDGGHL